MKKVFFMVAAVAAMTFASCDNKPTNTQADAADSVAVEAGDSLVATSEGAAAAAQTTIDELKAKIDAKDASAIQTALQAAQAKAAEFLKANPELAKEYLAKVQEFVKTNAETIKSAVGDNAVVNGLLTTLTTASADDVVSKFTETLDAAAAVGDGVAADAAAKVTDAAAKAEALKETVKNAPEAVKEAAKEKVEAAKEDVKAKANEKVEEGKQKAGAAIDKAASDVKGKLGL